MSETPDLPEPSLPAGTRATLVARQASAARKALARAAHMALLVPDAPPDTKDRFLAKSQAWLDDLQVRAADEDITPKELATLATAWRKSAMFHSRLAGWEQPVGGVGLQFNTVHIEGGPGAPAYRAAGGKLEAFRREQDARLREMRDGRPIDVTPDEDGDE